MQKDKNKQWRDRHAKIKHRHELKRRNKLNERFYKPSTESYIPYQSEEYYQSDKAKRRLHRKLCQDRFTVLKAPKEFSIYSNPEETLSFFYNIETRIAFGDPVYFDMVNIEVLSIDTIIYFLATLKKIKSSKVIYGIKGSSPSNETCRELLEASGFYKYVNSGKTEKDLAHTSDIIQIENGEIVDNLIAKKVCDFTISKLNLRRTDISKLYDIIIELMSNTRQHAYSRKHVDVPDWYIFTRFVAEKKAVRFIFLDTGEGIPSTIRRKKIEAVKELMRFGSNHTKYIKSTLEGDFRTRTGQFYRGNGLPRIYSYYNEEYIKDLTIISNFGYFSKENNGDMEKELKGTLFYWELSKE